MTDLPPIEYLDEAAKLFDYADWFGAEQFAPDTVLRKIIAHAHALHQLAQARAEIAALKPRETLEDVARREVRDLLIKSGELETSVGRGVKCFLRGVQMQKEGVLPDE